MAGTRRDYAIVLVSAFTGAMIGNMLYPVLSIYAKNVSGDYIFSGMMFAFPYIITVAMSFAWGAISDYIGNRKAPLIIGGIIGSMFYFIFPFLDIVPLLLARSLQTVFTASGILSTAIVTEYYPNKKGRSIGFLNVASGIGGVFGGLLLGFFISTGDIVQSSSRMNLLFIICGVVSLISVLAMLPIKEVYKKRATGGRTLFTFKNQRQIWVLFASALILAVGIHLVFGVFPAYLTRQYGAEIGVIGLFMASSAGFGILSSAAVGVLCDRVRKKWMLVGAMTAYVLAMLAYGFGNNFYIILIIWSIPIWPFFWITGTSVVSDLTDENERGRGLGLMNAVSLGIGGFLGCILGGFLLDVTNFTTLCIIGAVLCLAGLAVALAIRDVPPGKCGPIPLSPWSRMYNRLVDMLHPKP